MSASARWVRLMFPLNSWRSHIQSAQLWSHMDHWLELLESSSRPCGNEFAIDCSYHDSTSFSWQRTFAAAFLHRICQGVQAMLGAFDDPSRCPGAELGGRGAATH